MVTGAPGSAASPTALAVSRPAMGHIVSHDAVAHGRNSGDMGGETAMPQAGGHPPRTAGDRPNLRRCGVYSAAMRTWGWASRTAASTWVSNLAKFSWNMATSRRAVASNAALSAQVFDG